MAVVMLPTGGFTVDDLDHFPDDSNRYELIEGSLHVTPSPTMGHQNAVANLFRVLDAACPATHRVWFAPLDVVFSEQTVLQPDVFVLPGATPHERRVGVTPVLAAEVLSPSTRTHDLATKRHVYREAGVGTYLVVDPAEPRITAWVWTPDGEQERSAVADAALDLLEPFPVTLVAADLIR